MKVENLEGNATWKQLGRLKIETRYDWKACNLTKQQAADFIDAAINHIPYDIPSSAVEVPDFQTIWEEAMEVGFKAADDKVPKLMVVKGGASVKVYNVPQGVCGFAWVIIKPATCSFARWCRKNKGSSKAYRGGEQIWISSFGQSYEKKMAYAGAFANVLTEYGIKAYAGGRLD